VLKVLAISLLDRLSIDKLTFFDESCCPDCSLTNKENPSRLILMDRLYEEFSAVFSIFCYSFANLKKKIQYRCICPFFYLNFPASFAEAYFFSFFLILVESSLDLYSIFVFRI